VVEEVWTPPLSTHLADSEVRSLVRPPLSCRTHIGRKLGPGEINEFALGQGKIPTVSFSITIAEPDHAAKRQPRPSSRAS